jgi:hypothetical protein
MRRDGSLHFVTPCLLFMIDTESLSSYDYVTKAEIGVGMLSLERHFERGRDIPCEGKETDGTRRNQVATKELFPRSSDVAYCVRSRRQLV